MKRYKRILVGVPLVVALGFGTLWKISGSWSFTFIGTLVNSVETDKPWVALTFDDGPTPNFTERVLAILNQHGVKATFFVT